MEDHPETRYTYLVDADDRILQVDPNWCQFAIENGAPHLPESVIGEELYRFFGDPTLVQLYREIAAGVRRTKRTVIVPFRCDSADRVRLMELEIEALDDGVLRYQGVLLEESAMAERPTPRPGRRIPTCSVCLFTQMGEEWVSPGTRPNDPEMSEWSLCPTCSEALAHWRSLGSPEP
ncbi:MAG: hypothetical protein M9921_11160 [Fimbriimonadaceae bacterium]|nr:hypothetical protein [Fimbriimonadaceae bacterium]